MIFQKMSPLHKFIKPDQYHSKSCSKMVKILLQLCIYLLCVINAAQSRVIVQRSTDNSVRGYLTERICWWNEVCKEEFQSQFRCKCPEWSFCRAPGRYYNAFCSMTATGYIWSQPGLRGS